MALLFLIAVLIALVALAVLGYFLWDCRQNSSENMCVCQGEGRERCLSPSERQRLYNSGAFLPQFAGV